LPPELLLLVQICTKSFVGWGFTYSAPPDPLAGFKGPISKGRRGKGKVGEGKGKVGGGRWEGKGKGPPRKNLTNPALIGGRGVQKWNFGVICNM